MIVCASRRADIPALHTEWFLNRLREGYCIVTHHTASGIYHRVPLTTDVVDCIVFRSKNPAPMLRRLDERIETFRQLSRTTVRRNCPALRTSDRNLRPHCNCIESVDIGLDA